MLTLVSDRFSPAPLAERILRAVLEKRTCILLVPEQQTLITEAQLATVLPPDAPLYFEASNFSRLANRTFRTVGGLCYRYADAAAKSLLMWKTLDAVAPLLEGGRTAGSVGRVKEMLRATEELRAASLSPALLRRAASCLEEGTRLKTKLSDLSLVMEIYDGERGALYGSEAEDLDRLAACLKEKPLYKDTLIFVSGFTSFTTQQLSVLSELLRSTSVTLSLTLPEEKENALAFEETEDTKRTLLQICSRIGCHVETELLPHPPMPPALRHAREHLFRTDRKVTSGSSEGLRLLCAPDPFEGAAFVASEIAAAVRSGARFRDFAVIVANTETYRGILDEALQRQGIPFFMSVRTALSELALPKTVLAAYACIVRGFKRADVLSYLKYGMTGISPEEGDLFELYLSFWHPSGEKIASNEPFEMNPSGYKDDMSDREAQTLCTVNHVKEKLLSPLRLLRDAANAAKTAKEHAKALYDFLCRIDAERTLRMRAADAANAGRSAEAEALVRLTGMLYALLDRTVEVMEGTPLSAERFAEILSLLFSSTDLGALPTSSDAVTVGNADMLRTDGARTVFLLGANEGELPGSLSLDGTFEETERQALQALGITVGSDPVIRASRESFVFLRALCAAQEKAYVIAFSSDAMGAAARRSSAFSRLELLCPQATIQNAKTEIYTRDAAVHRFFEARGSAEGDALEALLRETPQHARLIRTAGIPISDTECTVSPETAARLFPDSMESSQSKLDSFNNCPFSYYCRYLLGLPETKRASFESREIGNMIHALLERFFLLLDTRSLTIRTVKQEDLPLLVEEVSSAYLREICPESQLSSPRLSHLFSRLRRATGIVIEDLYLEFQGAAFVPVAFELPLTAEDGPGSLVFEDEQGRRVSMRGVIDRVDTYRAENGTLYARVVDYKTGTRSFSREELRQGRGMQMFLYLASIWKSKNPLFLQRICGNEKGEILPAGMLYMMSAPNAPILDAPTEDGEIREAVRDKIKRDGLFLADEVSLSAMDESYPSHFLPLPTKRNGEVNFESKKLVSLVEMDEMVDEMENAVCAIAARMRKGEASADPATGLSFHPCDYCAYLPVCRRTQ